MDGWKAEMGRVREKRRVEERRSEKRKSQKKEDADARKGKKVAKHCVFPMICGSEGSKSRKVGSLKRRVRSHLARWEMKNCTPLWREAHFEVKMYKTHQVRTTFGSCDVEKVHAVVAQSTFGSQNVQNTPCSDHFWQLRCRKNARPCGAKHISKSKCEVNMYKTHHVRTTFGHSDLVLRGRRKGLCTFSKASKTWGFCSIFKNDGRRGVKRICKDAFSVAGAVQTTCSWEMLGGQGADFLRFWSIRSVGLLRWCCVTGAALCMTWHYYRWTAKIAKRNGTRPSALQSTFHFWRKSRRIASFLMLSSVKN